GQPIVFDGKPYTVIGVLAASFRLSGQPDLLIPLGQATDSRLQRRDAHPGVQVWGRLRPGASLTDAQAELALVGRRLSEEYPASNAGRPFVVEPLRPLVGDVGATLWLLLSAVGLVLLIVCGDVASLLLARAISRDRELAMRAALGAGRARLVRQCLTESAVLALMGGTIGVGVASFGVRPFVALWPGSLPRAGAGAMGWHVV